MVTSSPRSARGNAAGFTLIELLIAMGLSSVVLGSAVMLSTGVQRTAAHQSDDAAVQQDARYALDWIRQTIVSAGSNPYNASTTACPAAGTVFTALRLDPNGNGVQDDIRVQADVNPPNGLIQGAPGLCNEPGEDVTIAYDPANKTLTRLDRARESTPVAVTDAVVTGLTFTYLTGAGVVTTNPSAIASVRVTLTGRSRARNPYTRAPSTFVYEATIRLRSR
jgi:prepilin-type N-terminal cleavage/methylation domain-containing protein